MTRNADTDPNAADDRLSDVYRDAVGALIAARAVYETARSDHGLECTEAIEAGDDLAQKIGRGNELRERYDRIIDRRLAR